jgi:hypothetical protein
MVRATGACLALVALLAGVFFTRGANAHGPAQWIADGNYHDLKPPGYLCCGPSDCVQLSPDDVDVEPSGFFIRSLNEHVPMADVQWTEPGHGGFWRCHDTFGNRRCFFSDPLGS